jgi:ankyrin repeat protein
MIPKGETMSQEFFEAITQGDADKVREMLKANPELASAKDEKGLSAILKATYHGKKDVLAALLAAHPELNIFEAAATGQTERVRVRIQQDTTLVNAFAPDGFFPLGLAVFFGHLDTVEALLAAGAEVNAATRETMKVTALHSAAAARQTAIARVLIAHGARVNAEAGESAFRPLHEAAANGDLELAALLLENGADVNARMTDGKTPLAFSVMRKQDDMAVFLRGRGGVE